MDLPISELDHQSPDFKVSYIRAMTQINETVGISSLKEELVRFAATIGREQIAEYIPQSKIGLEAKIAYFLNRGAKLAPQSTEKVIKFLDDMESSGNDQQVNWEYLPETAHSKAIRAYVACYSRIDNAKTRVLLGKLEQRALANEVRKIVRTFGLGKIAITKQLAEHYKDSYLEARADPTIESWVKPLGVVVETLGLMTSNRESIKAGARRAKARRMVSTVDTLDRKGEKAASKVTYKDEDDKLGIRSVDPTNLVGAEAAVVFNTKTKHCEVYWAKSGSRLSVQGARIVNFDEGSSTGRTIRKPETDLPHWTRATTVRRLEVLLQGTKGKKWDVSGKLNRNTMIIKVL